MEVCILSMQKIQNFGSLLQAYGLKKMLEEQGHEVCFLDIKRIDDDYKLLGEYRNNFQYEILNDNISFYNKIYNKIQNTLFDLFRVRYLKINKKKLHYDYCVIGADEVFNCLGAGWWGFTSQLFGNVEEADYVITYAASCGSTRYDDLPDEIAKKIGYCLTNVKAISVRDANTKDFVKKILKVDPMFNMDPVFIYNFDTVIRSKKNFWLPSKYCIIYAYENRINKEYEIEAILKFCSDKGLTPITIGGRQKWCKKHYICSPFDCLSVFKHSSFVITDTFHGTIFSVKYADRYAIIVRHSNENKLTDLVNRIEINRHVIENFAELEEIYYLAEDKNSFQKLIKKEREKAYKYLDDNIC